jgi:hypothetical protein
MPRGPRGEKRPADVIGAAVAISRVCDVSLNTVDKLLEAAGSACAAFHYNTVRGVRSKRVQCDEIWSFCYSKQSNTPVRRKPDRSRRRVDLICNRRRFEADHFLDGWQP